MAAKKLPPELIQIRGALVSTMSIYARWIGPADQRALIGFCACVGFGIFLSAMTGFHAFGTTSWVVAAVVAGALRYTAPYSTWNEQVFSALHSYQPKDEAAYQALLRTIKTGELDRATLTAWHQAEVRRHNDESNSGSPEAEARRKLLSDRLVD